MIDKNIIKGVFQDAQVKVSADTAPVIYSAFKIPEGHVALVNRVCLRNKTSAATSFTMYVDDRGKEVILGYQAGPSQNSVYTITNPFWMHEGQRIKVSYVGAGVGDVIELALYGEEHVQSCRQAAEGGA